MGWKWTDARQIGQALYDAHPQVVPLEIRFTDLHRWVCELGEFDDDPNDASETKLEAIQMAWLEEWEE